MKCENNFCIYQANGACRLEEISIDQMGMCESCVYPELDKEYLEDKKTELLKTLETRDRATDDVNAW